jgi:predicted HicB family RNase H-like nuclease
MPQPLRYTEDRPQIQFRMPADVLARLAVEAERRGLSRTMLVERIITEALPKLEKQRI